LTYEQPKFISGLELSYINEKNELKGWQHFWKFPDLSHHLHFCDFGNQKELGQVIAYYPSLTFKIFQLGKFSSYFNMGTGISYMTNPFNSIDNTTNNAIGSHWNNITAMRFEQRIVLRTKILIFIAPQFFHYSNGSAKTPNSGINTSTLHFGLKYSLETIKSKKEAMLVSPNRGVLVSEFSSQVSPNKKNLEKTTSYDYDKFELELNSGLGFHQNKIEGGITFLVPQLSVLVHYYPFEYFRIISGFRFEYNQSKYYFSRHIFNERKEAKREAQDWEFSLGGDLIFGKVFARIQSSIYLPIYKKENDWAISNLLGMYVNLTKNCHVGISMKSQNFIAEHLSFNVGYTFL